MPAAVHKGWGLTVLLELVLLELWLLRCCCCTAATVGLHRDLSVIKQGTRPAFQQQSGLQSPGSCAAELCRDV